MSGDWTDHGQDSYPALMSRAAAAAFRGDHAHGAGLKAKACDEYRAAADFTLRALDALATEREASERVAINNAGWLLIKAGRAADAKALAQKYLLRSGFARLADVLGEIEQAADEMLAEANTQTQETAK